MNKLISLANILKIIAVALLFYATGRHSYSYYTFLRLYVFITCIYFAYIAQKDTQKAWIIVFVVISALFNPLIPIYLNKDVWSIIDISCGVLMLVSILKNTIGTRKND